jgi:phage shock protein E
MMIRKYNCDFLQQKLREGGQLIDVRSPVEFNRGALSGAVNIPIESFQYLKDDIDAMKPVLLYCHTGARSEMVRKYLVQLGFDQVHNIGGLRQFAGC